MHVYFRDYCLSEDATVEFYAKQKCSKGEILVDDILNHCKFLLQTRLTNATKQYTK
jgi:hypothetical protein